jgi:hypothetical protein
LNFLFLLFDSLSSSLIADQQTALLQEAVACLVVGTPSSRSQQQLQLSVSRFVRTSIESQPAAVQATRRPAVRHHVVSNRIIITVVVVVVESGLPSFAYLLAVVVDCNALPTKQSMANRTAFVGLASLSSVVVLLSSILPIS